MGCGEELLALGSFSTHTNTLFPTKFVIKHSTVILYLFMHVITTVVFVIAKRYIFNFLSLSIYGKNFMIDQWLIPC